MRCADKFKKNIDCLQRFSEKKIFSLPSDAKITGG